MISQRMMWHALLTFATGSLPGNICRQANDTIRSLQKSRCEYLLLSDDQTTSYSGDNSLVVVLELNDWTKTFPTSRFPGSFAKGHRWNSSGWRCPFIKRPLVQLFITFMLDTESEWVSVQPGQEAENSISPWKALPSIMFTYELLSRKSWLCINWSYDNKTLAIVLSGCRKTIRANVSSVVFLSSPTLCDSVFSLLLIFCSPSVFSCVFCSPHHCTWQQDTTGWG